jgi:hypothetical protein
VVSVVHLPIFREFNPTSGHSAVFPSLIHIQTDAPLTNSPQPPGASVPSGRQIGPLLYVVLWPGAQHLPKDFQCEIFLVSGDLLHQRVQLLLRRAHSRSISQERPDSSSDSISPPLNHLQPAENVFHPSSAKKEIRQAKPRANLPKRKEFMATSAQITANLANAKLSTGPKTEAGKQTSAKNSIKLGLYCKQRVVEFESMEQYKAFEAAILADLAPVGAMEEALVDDIIGLRWRLRRVEFHEMLHFENSFSRPVDLKAVNQLSLHAARLHRSASIVLKDLLTLQKRRQEREAEELAEAAVIREADVKANRPTNLAEFGFVFSTPFVDRYILRRNARKAAPAVPKAA